MHLSTLKRFTTNYSLIIGTIIVFLFIMIAVFGPEIMSRKSLAMNLEFELKDPTYGRLGFAENGIDVLASLVFGARVSLLVAFITTFISLIFGVSYGAISGYFGRRTDAIMMRLIDILLAFPGLLLAIYIAAILRPGISNIIIALSATGWVSYARLTRAQVIAVKERDFITAAQSLGATKKRIICQHIIPNILGPIIIQTSFGLSSLILAEAALSFIGLGVPPGTPSWGALLEQGVAYLLVAPHIAIFSGACIALVVLGFNFVGDGLRDALDSKNH